MPNLRCCLASVLVVLAGCSGSSPDDSAGSAPTDASSSTSVAIEAESRDDEGADASDEEDTPAPPPVEARDETAEVDANQESDPTSAWISRRMMSAEAIEMTWSAPEGAANYQVHRVVGLERVQPDDSEMTADNLIAEGDARGVVLDTEVTPDLIYWYGVRGLDADGNVLSTGWHPTASVTDEQPPAQVEVTLEQQDGTVLLSWSEPDENFRMHGYRILRAVGAGEPETVASTWNLEQTTFVDPDPPAGLITYSVLALDFHWNLSEPAEVTVELS